MQIDRLHPEVKSLIARLEESHQDQSPLRRFVATASLHPGLISIIVNAAQPFAGELALIYHEFSLVPSDRSDDEIPSGVLNPHYHVRVARLAEKITPDVLPYKELPLPPVPIRRVITSLKPEEEKSQLTPFTTDGVKLDFSRQFLLPAIWQRDLYLIPNSEPHSPTFVFDRRRGGPKLAPDARRLIKGFVSLEDLEHFLNVLQPTVRKEKKEKNEKKVERRTRTYITRTLQFKIILGTDAVEKWFEQQSNEAALETLRGLYQTVV